VYVFSVHALTLGLVQIGLTPRDRRARGGIVASGRLWDGGVDFEVAYDGLGDVAASGS
jgi:hypothetical protein